MRPVLVTFDLFSALIDSRTGASRGARRRSPPAAAGRSTATALRRVGSPATRPRSATNRSGSRSPSTARRALAGRLRRRSAWSATPTADAAVLLGLGRRLAAVAGRRRRTCPRSARRHRVGVLSNVDDDVFARTAVAPLVADDDVLTSERLRAYKPRPGASTGGRGSGPAATWCTWPPRRATSAGRSRPGIDVVRLRRPGHAARPGRPRPATRRRTCAQAGSGCSGRTGHGRDSS